MPIENVRTFLIIGLCGVLFLMWQAWQRDYGPNQTQQPAPVQTSEQGIEPPQTDSGTPDLPAVPEQPAAETLVNETVAEVKSDSVRVTTDLLSLDMNAQGVFRLRLLDYPVVLEAPEEKFPLLNDTLPNIFTIESGSLGSNGEPSQESEFKPQASEYSLQEGQDTLDVDFKWEGASGIRITRTF